MSQESALHKDLQELLGYLKPRKAPVEAMQTEREKIDERKHRRIKKQIIILSRAATK